MEKNEIKSPGPYKVTISPESANPINTFILISGQHPFMKIVSIWNLDSNRTLSEDILRGGRKTHWEKIENIDYETSTN